MKTAIEMKNISFAYEGKEKQLNDISLTIKQGEVVIITGPSGSGKSTLTRIINGLAPDFYKGTMTGEIRINDKNLNDIPSWERGKYIGNVFQDPRSQFFSNEVAGEIAFTCENYGFTQEEIIRRVCDSAKNVNIIDILDEKLRILSYGMRQRVAIASAKAIDPPIYLMDEPSANLDLESTEQFSLLIKKLKDMGKTILIAEHRLYYLKDIADRILYMEDGVIKKVYTPKDLSVLTYSQTQDLGLRCMDITSLPSKRTTVQSGNTFFEVKNLCKSFGDTIVAENISFACKKGEIIGIFGENGVGKSCLGKMISGLLQEDSGGIYFKGKKLRKGKRRGLIWYIMQDLDSQLFGIDLIDELLAGLKCTKQLSKKAESILDDLDLDDIKKYHPSTLSGGQKQRLVLGVALMRGAPIIILDEPTSGLDGENMRKVAIKIKELAKKGYIIFMITHDIECALETCSRGLHIKNGKLENDFKLENVDQLIAIMS